MSNVPDPAYPYVDVDLGDGEQRRFKYTALSSLRLKQAMGRALASLSLENLDEAEVIYLAWALLLHENQKITVDQVATLIDPGKFVEIAERAAQAVKAAFPQAPSPLGGKTKST